ncbi:MAG: cytochrome P450, partial [Actinomycetota bacterium]|nr:cytochrome P450 [Actinomycetota bacterium]
LEKDDLWVVPHFEHVWEVVRAPDSYSSKALRAVEIGAISARNSPRPDIRALDARSPKSLIDTDPPDHTRLRRLVSKPFTPRMVAGLADQTRRICEDAVDELLAAAERGDADLVRDFTFPVPVQVIALFLGIPGERRDDFKRWLNALVGRLDGQPLSEDQFADLIEMSEYFDEVVAERIHRPGDDLISWIIAGPTDGDDPLPADDLVAFCTVLLVAGNETTTNLLGNLFLAF